jgi:hypothetical protein
MSESDNQGLKGLFGPTPQCLAIEALASLASSTPVDPETRRHLEQCAHCRNELAMLHEFHSAEASPAEAEDVDWIVAGLRQRSAGQTSPARRLPAKPPLKSLWDTLAGWIPGGFPRWVPAAAAACLVVVSAVGLYLGRRDTGAAPTPGRGDYVWRSATLQVIGPGGDLPAPPAEFAWDEVPGAQSYLVRLLEVDRTEIWSARTAGTRIPVPAPIAAQLTAGRTFLWQVAASDSGGPIAESILQRFHISGNTR